LRGPAQVEIIVIGSVRGPRRMGMGKGWGQRKKR